MQSNDNSNLKVSTEIRNPVLQYDFPGVKVGIAQYKEGPTGCTVFYFDRSETKNHTGANFYADVRGGASIVRLHLKSERNI